MQRIFNLETGRRNRTAHMLRGFLRTNGSRDALELVEIETPPFRVDENGQSFGERALNLSINDGPTVRLDRGDVEHLRALLNQFLGEGQS